MKGCINDFSQLASLERQDQQLERRIADWRRRPVPPTPVVAKSGVSLFNSIEQAWRRYREFLAVLAELTRLSNHDWRHWFDDRLDELRQRWAEVDAGRLDLRPRRRRQRQ